MVVQPKQTLFLYITYKFMAMVSRWFVVNIDRLFETVWLKIQNK